jgi:hypothetical protein
LGAAISLRAIETTMDHLAEFVAVSHGQRPVGCDMRQRKSENSEQSPATAFGQRQKLPVDEIGFGMPFCLSHQPANSLESYKESCSPFACILLNGDSGLFGCGEPATLG